MTIEKTKKQKTQKRYIIQRKLKLGGFKHYLEATQLTRKLKQNTIKKSK